MDSRPCLPKLLTRLRQLSGMPLKALAVPVADPGCRKSLSTVQRTEVGVRVPTLHDLVDVSVAYGVPPFCVVEHAILDRARSLASDDSADPPALYSRAEALRGRGRYYSALGTFLRCRERAAGERFGEYGPRAALGAGLVLKDLRCLWSSEIFLEQVAVDARASETLRLGARRNLVRVHVLARHYREARRLGDEVLRQATERGDDVGVRLRAQITGEFAAIQERLGHYDEAIPLLDESLAILAPTPHRLDAAILRVLRATCLVHSGAVALGLSQHRSAIVELRELDDGYRNRAELRYGVSLVAAGERETARTVLEGLLDRLSVRPSHGLLRFVACFHLRRIAPRRECGEWTGRLLRMLTEEPLPLEDEVAEFFGELGKTSLIPTTREQRLS